jgi:hypothetical protein
MGKMRNLHSLGGKTWKANTEDQDRDGTSGNVIS